MGPGVDLYGLMLGLSFILVIFSASRITEPVADKGFTRDAVTIATTDAKPVLY